MLQSTVGHSLQSPSTNACMCLCWVQVSLILSCHFIYSTLGIIPTLFNCLVAKEWCMGTFFITKRQYSSPSQSEAYGGPHPPESKRTDLVWAGFLERNYQDVIVQHLSYYIFSWKGGCACGSILKLDFYFQKFFLVLASRANQPS